MTAHILAGVKVHYFDDAEIVTQLHMPKNEYTAVFADDPKSPIGWGLSRFYAIADLIEKMAKVEQEPHDRLTARWDHQRDLRKHG